MRLRQRLLQVSLDFLLGLEVFADALEAVGHQPKLLLVRLDDVIFLTKHGFKAQRGGVRFWDVRLNTAVGEYEASIRPVDEAAKVRGHSRMYD